jgi:F-type H+-transporting ATPase subunit delta
LVRDIESALMQSGVVIADIASARKLTEALQDAIVAYVKHESGAKDVSVRTHIDESLIGGVRIRTPDAEYDASVRRQLTKLQAMKV